MPQEQGEEEYDQAQVFHSRFVCKDERISETAFAPKLLYYCAEVLANLCHGDW